MNERPNAKLAHIGGMLWSVCSIRKPTKCCITGRPLGKGDRAWRPISNGYDRMKRISDAEVNRLAPMTDQSADPVGDAAQV